MFSNNSAPMPFVTQGYILPDPRCRKAAWNLFRGRFKMWAMILFATSKERIFQEKFGRFEKFLYLCAQRSHKGEWYNVMLTKLKN